MPSEDFVILQIGYPYYYVFPNKSSNFDNLTMKLDEHIEIVNICDL